MDNIAMAPKRFVVVHWREPGSVYKPHCRPRDLRVPEANTTTNVDRVTCKVCKKRLGLP